MSFSKEMKMRVFLRVYVDYYRCHSVDVCSCLYFVDRWIDHDLEASRASSHDQQYLEWPFQ